MQKSHNEDIIAGEAEPISKDEIPRCARTDNVKGFLSGNQI